MRDAVSEKHMAMTSSPRPSASKICAPLYDWSVEMPILAMTLRMPTPTALMYFSCTRAHIHLRPWRI